MPLPAWGETGRLDGVLTYGFTWSCFSVDRLDDNWSHFCCPRCLEPLYLLTPEQTADARQFVGSEFRLVWEPRPDPIWLKTNNEPPYGEYPVKQWVRDLFDARDRHVCDGCPKDWGD